jgi:hypothetical protein
MTSGPVMRWAMPSCTWAISKIIHDSTQDDFNVITTTEHDVHQLLIVEDRKSVVVISSGEIPEITFSKLHSHHQHSVNRYRFWIANKP